MNDESNIVIRKSEEQRYSESGFVFGAILNNPLQEFKHHQIFVYNCDY